METTNNDIIFINMKNIDTEELFYFSRIIPNEYAYRVLFNEKEYVLFNFSREIVENIDIIPNITILVDIAFGGDLDLTVFGSLKYKITSIYGVLSKPTEVYIDCGGCIALENFLVKNIIASNLSSSAIFKDCINLKSISYIDFSKCTCFDGMFDGCLCLKYVSGLNFLNAKHAISMFSGCTDLEEVSNCYNTENLEDTSFMFFGCASLKKIPDFNLPSVIYANFMFDGCSSLESINILNFKNVRSITKICGTCIDLKDVKMATSSKLKNMDSAFIMNINLISVELDTSGVEDMWRTFYLCKNLKDLSNISLCSVKDLRKTFIGCGSLTSFPDLYEIPKECLYRSTFEGTILEDELENKD